MTKKHLLTKSKAGDALIKELGINAFSLESNKLKVSERSSTPRIVPPLRSFSLDEINDAVNCLLDTIGQTVISPWDGHLLCTTHGLT
jgi:hypothetical protein